MTLTIESTIRATPQFVAQLDAALAAGDFETLTSLRNAYGDLTAEAVREGHLGDAVGWAKLHKLADERRDELLRRRAFPPAAAGAKSSLPEPLGIAASGGEVSTAGSSLSPGAVATSGGTLRRDASIVEHFDALADN